MSQTAFHDDADAAVAGIRDGDTVLVGGYVIEGHVPAKEIARLLEEQRSMEAGHYVRVDASNITAPIDRLRAAGRIVRTAEKRPCGHSKNNVWAYFVPMTQLRLMA